MAHKLFQWGLLYVIGQIAAIPPEPINTPLTYQNFLTPLPAVFMPLCGNGRLDTIADYQQYFNTSAHLRLMVPRARLLDNAIGETEVQLAMNEVCDDGNRLDGDGCSADCLNFDSLVSPCEIAMPHSIVAIEKFAFFENKPVIATSDALYTLSADFLTATLLAPKIVTVRSMLAFQNELWVFADSSLHVVRAGLLQELFTVATSDDGYLLEHANVLYLVCKSADRIWLWNVQTRTIVSSLAGEIHPVIAYMRLGPALVLLLENNAKASISLDLGAVAWLANDAPSGDYWQAASNACFMPFINMETSTVNVSFKCIPDTTMTYTLGVQSRMLSPVVYTETMMGPRWLLNASESHHTRVQYFGATGFDTRLDYDVLKGGVIKQSPSYLETLQTNVNYSHPELWSSQFATLRNLLKQKIKRVAQITENPITKSLWILQNGTIKDISRRGIQIRRNGQCVPTPMALCPACLWSPDGTACKPCPATPETSLEWTLQCQPCSTATGLARRRLLVADSLHVIAFSVMLNSEASIGAVFPQATIVSRGDGVYDVEIDATADPQAVMRSVQLKLQPFTVVAKPRLLYDTDSAASSIMSARNLAWVFALVTVFVSSF